ncbi:hypothetical protein E4T39_06327 [Aureobasidium subglaciale]|nr:hypothetical protein E4T39_06327 [Aureobasidium subglaciale]
MPARQHPASSEVALSPSPTLPHHRSSLRRLSSLANLQQFNPFNSFNRRRSSHGTQNSDEDPYLLKTYQQTYMSLSEDPLPVLPKSRTFSNLPMTRTRNHSKPPASMKPSSRIPTPSMGLNARARLASATKSILKVGNRRGLVRSDTEPLLIPHRTPDASGSARVLKENVSLSTNKSETETISLQLASIPLVLLDINARRPETRAAPVPSLISRQRPSVSYLPSGGIVSSVNIARDDVTSAQSTAYWSGRLMSQFDSHRNEKLQACVSRGELSSKYPENDLNLCLRELQKKCVTEAAKLSFAMFKARVHVKAGTLGTTRGTVKSGIEGRGKDMVEA